MKYEVYCDESRQELFSSKTSTQAYTVLGGIWLDATKRAAFKSEIKEIRKTHSLFSEFKWAKVSNNRLDFFIDVVEWFLRSDIRFRALVIKSDELDVRFHDCDTELMFYKFYYLLLSKWMLDFNQYSVFLDLKTNKQNDRIKTLERCLQRANLTSSMKLQALPSHEVDLLQLADVLIGCVSYKFHNRVESKAKMKLIEIVESRINKDISPTSLGEEKFNVFRFKPGGGW